MNSDRAAQVMSDLDAAIDTANDVMLAALDVEELNSWLIDTHRLVQRVDALHGAAVREATTTQLSKRHGEHSLATHIAGQTHGNSRTIGMSNSFARWLHDFDVLATAYAAGSITRNLLVELRTLDRKQPAVHRHLVVAQDFLVEAAVELQWPQWLDAVGYWVNSIDPDGTLTDPADPKFGMTIRKLPDGTVRITGLLDPVTGEAAMTAIEHVEKKLRRAEEDNPDGSTLSSRQRTLTAFMRLITRGYRRKDGSYPDPLVQIVMSERVAEDVLARTLGCVEPTTNGPLDIDPYELPIDWGDVDGRCETIRGTPLHPIHAWIPLLIGTLRRVVFDDEGKPVELGSDARLFPPKLRAALLAQFRGHCAVPGCNNPYTWLEMDHVKPSSRGGRTHLNNGKARCGPHNRAKGDRL